jgi:hypothetical protein
MTTFIFFINMELGITQQRDLISSTQHQKGWLKCWKLELHHLLTQSLTIDAKLN